MCRRTIFLFCFAFFSSTGLIAQSQGPVYQPFGNVAVTANGYTQTMPFCGGFNNPQFTMGDLNGDGIQDLVVFENDLGVKTFINEGTATAPRYVFEPQYALNFPSGTSYMTLADYNHDGVPDLFTQRSYIGFEVFRGYYNANKELAFTYYKDLWYYNDTQNHFSGNAYVNLNTDIPAIVDVDNDGDLDFLSFDINGKFVVEYKNIRALLNYHPDSIVIELKDNCWGKFYQPFFRTHVLGYDCDESGLYFPPTDTFYNKVTHTGNSICLFDYDGDGDYDYLDGSISFNEMTLCINGRVERGIKCPDSMISQDTFFNSKSKGVELPLQPAAFNIDIDGDGKKDLIIAPHSAGASENYKCVWFYKNETTPGHPSWTFESDTMFIDQTIDVGTAAYPAFFDYDHDGKPDLFVGGDGYYQTSGLLIGKLAYYHNTSTKGHPSFALVTKDFLGISTQSFQGVAPAFGDLNNDSAIDMIIGHTDGTLSFYQNFSSVDTGVPQWLPPTGRLQDSAGNVIGLNSDHAAPFIYDVNKDGKPDLIIGGNTGYIQYYENHSTTKGVLNLVLKTGKLGKVKVDSLVGIGTYSTPFIGKMDNSGRDYLLVGSNSGSLYRYTGFQKGDVPAYFPRVDSQYSFIDTTSSQYWHNNYGYYNGLRSAPAVADIDGDGKYEMVVGEVTGGLRMYEQVLTVGVPIVPNETNFKVTAYPNPARDLVNINWEAGFAQGDIQITIYNPIGQEIAEKVANNAANGTQMALPNLPNGIYFCVVTSGNHKSTVQITILK